jgi:hypothetical protein
MPLRSGALPEALAAHLRHYVAIQKQWSGRRSAASGVLHAFLLDPMTSQSSTSGRPRRCSTKCSPPTPPTSPGSRGGLTPRRN